MNTNMENICNIIINTEKYKKYHYIVEDFLKYPFYNDIENGLYNFRYNNLQCSVKRCSGDNWCGYVEFLHSVVDFNEDDSDNIEVYGDITYFQKMENGLFKAGFDTSHFQDLSPIDFLIKYPDLISIPDYKTYKTYDFVVNETKKLARQISGYNNNN